MTTAAASGITTLWSSDHNGKGRQPLRRAPSSFVRRCAPSRSCFWSPRLWPGLRANPGDLGTSATLRQRWKNDQETSRWARCVVRCHPRFAQCCCVYQLVSCDQCLACIFDVVWFRTLAGKKLRVSRPVGPRRAARRASATPGPRPPIELVAVWYGLGMYLMPPSSSAPTPGSWGRGWAALH
jgi:hypothetical protein